MKNYFTDHPHRIGETYWAHFTQACRFSFVMLFGALACLVHAIFPFLFEKTASQILLTLTYRFIKRTPFLNEKMVRINEVIEEKKLKI